MISTFKINDCLVFLDPLTGKDDIYNYSTLGLPEPWSSGFRDGFMNITANYKRVSRRQAWRSIIKFSEFMKGEPQRTDNVIVRFGVYLYNLNLKNSTCGSHYNFIKALAQYATDVGDIKIPEQSLIDFDFGRSEQLKREVLSRSQLALIYKACKVDLRQVREDFLNGVEVGKATVNSVGDLSAAECMEIRRVYQLRALDSTTEHPIKFTNKIKARIRRYLELTASNMFPIYLMLMLKTGGNPEALRSLGLDCLEEHPYDSETIFFIWQKGRAHGDQKISSTKKGLNSIPGMVDLVLQMTALSRVRADSYERDYLFLTSNRGLISRASHQSLHDSLQEFQQRHNLPNFTFRDIRKGISEIVMRKTQSTVAVKNVLQHKDLRTVRSYLGERSHELSYEIVNRFQGQMIAASYFTETVPNNEDTLLGLACTNPSDSPYSPKDKPCLEFMKCATCPNAIIIKDSPHQVAKIIRAIAALETTVSNSIYNADDIGRCEKVYKPLLSILHQEIIPKIGKAVYKEAAMLATNLPPLPRMY